MTLSPMLQAAQILLEARQSGQAIANLPAGLDPQTREEAYLIQDAMAAELGPVGAWKIMAGGEGEPLNAPLPARFVHSGAAPTFAQVLPVTIIEVEVAMTLGTDLPGRDLPYTAQDVRSAIASFHPALELISFSWVDRDQVPRLTQVADLQNHAGLIVGPALANWESLDTTTLSVELLLDGQSVTTTQSGASSQQILEALAWLANHAAKRNLALKAGQVITTGARVLHRYDGQRRAEGQVSGLGSVRVELN